MEKLSVNVCGKCKRVDWILITKEDLIKAQKGGGLFLKVIDHDGHIITLKKIFTVRYADKSFLKSR